MVGNQIRALHRRLWNDPSKPIVSSESFSVMGWNEDAKALAEAIITLIDNPALRKEMGRRGREMVEEAYSLVSVSEKTLAVYDRLLLHDA